MNNLKPFDPKDIDDSLIRIAAHGRSTHMMFPYINATGSAPKFESINCVINGPKATAADFAALAKLVKESRNQGEWYISFNTPWLITHSDADSTRQRVLMARADDAAR